MTKVSILWIGVLHVLVTTPLVNADCGRDRCYDSFAQKCRKRGYQSSWEEPINRGYKLIKWCRIPGDGTKRILIARAKCPSPEGLILNGKSWTNKTSCYKYTCRLYKPSRRVQYPTVHIEPRSIGCPFKGGCVGRGKTWTEAKGNFKVTYRCTHVGGLFKEQRFIRFQGIKCKLGNTWVRMNSRLVHRNAATCESYRCPSRRWVRLNKKLQLISVTKGCRTANGCQDIGATWNKTMDTFVVSSKCIFFGSQPKVSVEKAYCPHSKAPGGYIEGGKSFVDLSECLTIYCIAEIANGVLTNIQKTSGPVTYGKCAPRRGK